MKPVLARLKFACTVAVLLTGYTTAWTQTGSIAGAVSDEQTGEQLVGANVLVVGTTMGAATDLDGKFEIRNVIPGTYNLRVSYIGYATKMVSDLEVKENEVFRLNLTLSPSTYDVEEVVITAERVLATESALLAERKKATTIGDGISAEQIKRAPDATSGDALKRVTGLSIVDNKFVFIRGVTDRYNGATLNGVNVTSADLGSAENKKSFNFDMVPANLLENMIVTKTASPDLPGDLTGGLVQISTIDFPERRSVKFSTSTSYNSISNLTSLQMSQGGNQDWLGFDDGTRSQPPDGLDQYQIGQSLPNTWAQRTRRAPLNGSFSLSIGDRLELGEQDLFGYIAALSYQNSFQREQATWGYLTPGTLPISKEGTKDSYNVLWGGILDMNYKFDGLHKISIQNNFNQSGQDRLTRHQGIDENEQIIKTEVTEWGQRSMYVVNASGEHNLPSVGGLTINWRGAYSESRSKEPDRRESIYTKNMWYPEEYPFSTSSGNRLWETLDDYSRSGAVDFSLPLGSAKFKAGGVYETKNSDYKVRFYVTELEGSANQHLIVYGIDSVYSPENYGPGKWYVQRIDDRHDVYQAEQELVAGYAMLDIPFALFSEGLRITGGARVENSEQLIHTVDPGISEPTPFTVRVKNVDILPSVNLTYIMNNNTNLRLAYGHSVNRPEFRELSPTYFFSYADFEGRHGNVDLKRAYIHNYDVRLEVFPEVGEVLSASYFYKRLSNAIEQNLIVSTAGTPERSWFNSPKGKNYGFELEARKTFSFLRDIRLLEGIEPVSSAFDYLSNLSVTGNYARIFSEIDYVDEDLLIAGVRQMQGQSPWLINVSLSFREPHIGTGITFLYNRFGRRIDAVGQERVLDVFEESRGVIDISITQPVWSDFEMKFTVKDLNPKAKRFTFRSGEEYKTEFLGRTFSVQASYSL